MGQSVEIERGASENAAENPREYLRELLEAMVEAIVDEPNKVRVSMAVGDDVTLYEVNVGPKDIGVMLGKQGSHASAMRTIFGVASAVQKIRTQVNFVSPKGDQKGVPVRRGVVRRP